MYLIRNLFLRAGLLCAIALHLGGCVFMRSASDFGVHALCQATGQPSACLSMGDIVRLQQTTGYLDIARLFPGVVSGVGTILQASDAYGLRYVGNAMDCLPESARPPLQVGRVSPPEQRQSWSEVDDYVIYARAFVQIEQPEKLGPSFGDINAVHVQVRSVERVAVDPQALQEAVSSSYRIVSATCREALLTGHYIVTDALRVGEVAYAFIGKGDRRLSMSSDTLPNYMTPRPESGLVFEGNKLITRAPKYFAIGKVIAIAEAPADEADLVETISRHCKYVRNCNYY